MDPVVINLALQGGGAHGAFTWGVLDRLLEEEWIEIEGITATSAGAMNAAAFKSGWVKGGRQGAREALDGFWEAIGGLDMIAPEPVRSWLTSLTPPLQVLSTVAEFQAQISGQALLSQVFSPYDYPFYRHPLEPIVRDFDFDCVCADEGPKLFINTTRVRNGKIKVFKGDGVTADAILASACLPTLYRAIEIYDDETERVESFWDGGYMGNPAIFPLFYHTETEDVLIVHINPLERETMPRTVREIQNRVNEISFNSSLFRELRSIEFVKRLIREGKMTPQEMKDVRVHSVADDATMRKLSVATKLAPTPALLTQLKEAGQTAMETFLSTHAKGIGKETTCEIHKMIDF